MTKFLRNILVTIIMLLISAAIGGALLYLFDIISRPSGRYCSSDDTYIGFVTNIKPHEITGVKLVTFDIYRNVKEKDGSPVKLNYVMRVIDSDIIKYRLDESLEKSTPVDLYQKCGFDENSEYYLDRQLQSMGYASVIIIVLLSFLYTFCNIVLAVCSINKIFHDCKHPDENSPVVQYPNPYYQLSPGYKSVPKYKSTDVEMQAVAEK